MNEPALVERHGAVWTIRLNRPGSANAVDPATSRAMNAHVAAFEADPEARVAVIAASGEGAFCAGADLRAVAEGRVDEILGAEPYGFAGVVRGERTKPMVAAVDGAALGGGFEIALACDLVVASERATFGLPEVRRGLIAIAGGLERLPLRLPPARAMQLLLTGQPMDAAEAHRLGLLSALVAPGEAEAHALALAGAIAANAPVAVVETRAAALESLRAGERAGQRRAARAWTTVTAGADAREGARAFAEGRPPRWTGS